MQIHVVQPGQTLYGLSQAYDVPVETIAEANEINPANTLVVGHPTRIFYAMRRSNSDSFIKKRWSSILIMSLPDTTRESLKIKRASGCL